MPQTYNLGKVSLTPRGEFSPNVSYTALDVVSYDGSSYLVLQPVFSVVPPNPNYYMLLASKGDKGNAGDNASIAAGIVTSIPAGGTPSVTNSGTNTNATFNFAIPSGNMWYVGTGITGTSNTPTVFTSSGVSDAGVGDLYLNTNSDANGGNVYQCTVGGSASSAQWVFVMSILGVMDNTVTYTAQSSKSSSERLVALANVGVHVGNTPPQDVTTDQVPVGELYAYFTV